MWRGDSAVYAAFTGILFFIVAIAHFLRAIFSLEVRVGSIFIPIWVSWIAFAFVVVLAFFGLRICRHIRIGY